MAESKTPNLNERIWRGDEWAIGKMRRLYEADPKKQFVSWVSTLDSFRDSVSGCREELMGLVPQIIEWSDPATLLVRSSSREQAADRADVLSAVLAWVPSSQSRALREAALHLVRIALGWDNRQDHHTRIFLTIRAAMLALELEGASGFWTACNTLDHGTWLVVRRVRDHNQRARVYQMLADFHRRTTLAGLRSGWIFAAWYFLAALLVPSIPWDIRRKTLRALWTR